MRKSIFTFLAIVVITISCNATKSFTNIQPKSGSIDIPAKGELRIWNTIKHPSFEVELTNNNENASCELYYVKPNGNEKWVSPSLLAKSSKTITIPADGHLFIKNFNPNTLTITYKINE